MTCIGVLWACAVRFRVPCRVAGAHWRSTRPPAWRSCTQHKARHRCVRWWGLRYAGTGCGRGVVSARHTMVFGMFCRGDRSAWPGPSGSTVPATPWRSRHPTAGWHTPVATRLPTRTRRWRRRNPLPGKRCGNRAVPLHVSGFASATEKGLVGDNQVHCDDGPFGSGGAAGDAGDQEVGHDLRPGSRIACGQDRVGIAGEGGMYGYSLRHWQEGADVRHGVGCRS